MKVISLLYLFCILFISQSVHSQKTETNVAAKTHENVPGDSHQGSDMEQHDHNGNQHSDEHETKELKHHVIGFSIGHTQVFSGVKNGENQNLILPSSALSYSYFFNHKWGIGLHNEFIVEEFVVQGNNSDENGELFDSNKSASSDTNDQTVIERGRPIAVALIGIYRVHEHISLLAGGGREFSEHEDFWLVKFGVDFPWHFGNNWEVFGAISFDINIDAYNSMSYGIGVAKML